MTRRVINLSAILALAFLPVAYPVYAQQLEREPSPAGEATPSPYLPEHEVDYRGVLGPPPSVDSYQDKADIAAVKLLQSVDQQRWKSAQVDAVLLYPRFDEALGKPIDRATSPLLIKLLNRTLRDISASAFSAKLHFQRPRPYQSLALQRVCGTEKPPVPESHPSSGSSYPSGHSAYGWAVAMVLARVSPGRTDALMIRAQQYAESRVICGVHFPSDVEAGQVLAAAVVARLDGSADFQADLARARAEYSSH